MRKDGPQRVENERNITYAPSYLLGLRRDEIFDSSPKKSVVSTLGRSPLIPKANITSPIRLKVSLLPSDLPSLKDLRYEFNHIRLLVFYLAVDIE